MYKKLFTLFTFTVSFIGISQELSFSAIAFEPAYCRLHDYQSGNGVIFASATGGTPSYNYLWEHLETGSTYTNSIWGGRNPGTYKITVTDATGSTISETIVLDSINVIANFHAFSDDLIETPDGYIGFSPDDIGFINTSENFYHPIEIGEPTFFWNFDYPSADWVLTHEYTEPYYAGFYHGGAFDVCLVASNKNGCSDTICKPFFLLGSMIDVEQNEEKQFITITTKHATNEIIIENIGIEQNISLYIYTVTGQLLHQEDLSNTTSTIPFNYNRGIYLYTFYNKAGQPISKGKFKF